MSLIHLTSARNDQAQHGCYTVAWLIVDYINGARLLLTKLRIEEFAAVLAFLCGRKNLFCAEWTIAYLVMLQLMCFYFAYIVQLSLLLGDDFCMSLFFPSTLSKKFTMTLFILFLFLAVLSDQCLLVSPPFKFHRAWYSES